MGLLHKTQTAFSQSRIALQNFQKRRSKDYSNKIKLYVIGIHKCGTTSLEKFFTENGFEFVREESIFKHSQGLLKHKFQYPDYQTLLIIREPLQRIWSQYNYRFTTQKGGKNEINCSFEEAMKLNPEIIDSSNYQKWIDRWKNTNPIILKLEDVSKTKTFPVTNTTIKSELNTEQKMMIKNACLKQRFDPNVYDDIKFTPFESLLKRLSS